MTIYRTLFGIDLVVLVVVSLSLLSGLLDNSISASDTDMWLPLFGIPAAALLGGRWLNATGRAGLAKALLAVPIVLLCMGALVVVVVLSTLSTGHH